MLVLIMPLHHIVNLSLDFDLLTTIQVSFLLGSEIQEIPCRLM